MHNEAKQTETSVWSRERFSAGPGKEKGWLVLKKLKLPDGFQGRVFMGKICGELCRVYDLPLTGWWGGHRVVIQESQSSAFWLQPVRSV